MLDPEQTNTVPAVDPEKVAAERRAALWAHVFRFSAWLILIAVFVSDHMLDMWKHRPTDTHYLALAAIALGVDVDKLVGLLVSRFGGPSK